MMNSLLRNPENHYLNLHTTVHAGGAVRAQLAAANPRMPRIVDVISAVSDSRLRTLAPGGQFTIFGDDLVKVPTALGGLVVVAVDAVASREWALRATWLVSAVIHLGLWLVARGRLSTDRIEAARAAGPDGRGTVGA